MESNQNNRQDEIKISKKKLYIIGGIAVGLLGIGGGYFAFNKGANLQNNSSKIDSLSMKKDSAMAKKDSLQNEEGDEEYERYGEYRIISKEVVLPSGQKLNFGDIVYKDYEKSSAHEAVIYLNDPAKTPSAKSYPISINEEMMIDAYSFDDYRNKFSLPPYSSLPSGVKKLLMNVDGEYKNDRRYYITQNADRAKSTLVTGDFDGDGTRDVAVVLDDNEKQESRLLIIAINKATGSPYIAFAESYSDKLKIKAFPKGASIYMNSTDFVKSPREGVLISNEYGGVAIVYDSQAQKFKPYEQEPPSAEVEE